LIDFRDPDGMAVTQSWLQLLPMRPQVLQRGLFAAAVGWLPPRLRQRALKRRTFDDAARGYLNWQNGVMVSMDRLMGSRVFGPG
jgi:hypothetical protein